MKALHTVFEKLMGPGVPVGVALARHEALQPVQDTRAYLDFERFIPEL